MSLTVAQILYVAYVTEGGSDVCFRFGMAGRCGPDCPEYGKRDGCAGKIDDQEEAKQDG